MEIQKESIGSIIKIRKNFFRSRDVRFNEDSVTNENEVEVDMNSLKPLKINNENDDHESEVDNNDQNEKNEKNELHEDEEIENTKEVQD